MARANNGGWNFIRVGNIYQYKEDYVIWMVKILEDNSTDEEYRFKIEPLAGNYKLVEPFEVSHVKDVGGMWNDMLQFYETPVYCTLPLGTPWAFGEPYLGIEWEEEK